MCDTIRLKNGTYIQSVEEFEKHFEVKADSYKYDYYDEIIKDACLCQIDLEEFFAKRKDFELDAGDWWQK